MPGEMALWWEQARANEQGDEDGADRRLGAGAGGGCRRWFSCHLVSLWSLPSWPVGLPILLDHQLARVYCLLCASILRFPQWDPVLQLSLQTPRQHKQ